MNDCAKPGDVPEEDRLWLRTSKVNEILQYLMSIPVPFQYSEPAIRELRAEVERCNGAR